MSDQTGGPTGGPGEQAFAPDNEGYGDQPNQSADQSEAGSPVLDQLYAELGRAQSVSEQLLDGDRQDLGKIAEAETRLMAERDESEAAGDQAKTQAIEQDLDRLREAYLTIKDRLGDEDEQQDDDGRSDERSGDRDDDHPSGGAPDAGAADRGDG